MEEALTFGVNQPTKPGREVFPELPFDVIYEICSVLAPDDLLHLSWSNKVMYNRFMSKHSESWWIVSRKHVGCPEPPEGYPEPKWASLICADYCQECGKKDSSQPEFDLMVNMCETCFNNQKLSNGQLQSMFPKQYNEGLPYLVLVRGYTEDDKFYMKKEVQSYLDKLALLDSREVEKAFKKKQGDFVKTVVEKKGDYSSWSHSRKPKRKKELTDIFYFNERLNKIIIKERMHLFQPTYEFYLETLPSRQKAYQPPLIEVCHLEEIARVLCSNPTMPVEKFHMSANWLNRVFDGLPRYIQPWLDTKTEFLVMEMRETLSHRDILPKEDEFDVDIPTPLHEGPDYVQYDPTGAHLTKLAVSVYRCPTPQLCTGDARNKQVVVGWDEVFVHKCFFQDHSDGSKRELDVDYEGARVARDLINLAGLNPKRQTPLAMDRRGMRVICLKCAPLDHSDDTVQRRIAHSWRSAIEHAVSDTHSVEWKVLTDSEIKGLEYEGEDLAASESCWTCNHCFDFVERDEWCTKEEVLTHLVSVHNVTEPKMQKDYFIYESLRNSQEPTAVFLEKKSEGREDDL